MPNASFVPLPARLSALHSRVTVSAQMLWTAESDGAIVAEQPDWSAFTGQTHDEYRGYGWLDAVHPDDRARVAETWSRAVTTPSPVEMAYRLRRQDGEYRSFSVRGIPVLDANGGIRAWIGTHADTTIPKLAEEELHLLLNINELLASPLDYEDRLESTARLVVTHLADWCGISLLKDGRIERVATAHRDPEKQAAIEPLVQIPTPLDHPGSVARVIRTGKSLLFPDLSDAHRASIARDPGRWAVIRALDLKSAIVVPLVAGGEVVGAITLVSGESGRRYGARELALAENLARLMGLAFESSRLFREAHETRKVMEQQAVKLELQLEELRIRTAQLERSQAELEIAQLGLRRTNETLTRAEARLQHVLEASPTVTYTLRVGRDGISWSWVGANVRRVLGYAPEAALAEGWWVGNLHPDDRDDAQAAFERLFARGELSHHYRLRHEDGTYRWIQDDLRLVRDETGEPTEIVGSWVDISDQRETEAALRESEEKLRQVTENIREIFWMFDSDFRETIYVSPAYEEIWGQSVRSLYEDARSFLGPVHPDDVERLLTALAGGKEGIPIRMEFRLLHPDESVRWVRARGFPVFDERGEVYRVVGTTEDVTTRKQAEADRAAAEEHYHRLVETSPYAIYALDREGRFTEVNKAATGILARSAEDLIGHHMAEVLAPGDLPRAVSARSEKFSGATVHTDQEVWVIRPSGERRLVHVRSSLIEEAGVAVGTHGIVRDITEERARDGEMRLLAAALESLDEGVSVMRFDGQLIYANSTHARLLGYEVDGGALPNDGIFAPDEAEAKQAAEILRAVAEHGTWSGRVRRRRVSDGRILPLEVILGRVDREGAESVVFNILHDRTEEIQREQQFLRVERLASVGTMVGGIAHELNNPLHAVRNFAELMLMGPRDEQDREALEFIRSEADRAASVVADLRLFARQAQEEGHEREALNLNDVIRTVVQLRRYALETRSIEVVEELADGLPPIWANRGEIEQVVVSLVANAEEAMRSVAGAKQLALRTRPCALGATVQVSDTGTGIPAEHLERIFDPFFTTKPPRDGTGLGLSLVHSIVHEHGGDVRVESEVGRGTIFRIDLPRVPTSSGGAPRAAGAAAPDRPLRILLVDDEEALRRSGARYFAGIGHHVDAAKDGAEALRLLDAGSYDVIVSDLRMPGMGGEVLLERLRERGDAMEKRVVFVTGDTVNTPAARALSIAGLPVLTKPVDLATIARAVAEVARTAELERDA